MYESEEGQALVRQSIAEIFESLDKNIDQYRDTLGVDLQRDDEEADLLIRGPFGLVAYTHFEFRFLRRDVEHKARLVTAVGTASWSGSTVDDYRKLHFPTQEKKFTFQEAFKPVFQQEGVLLWNAGRYIGKAAEIVDLVLGKYLKAIEDAVRTEAFHRDFGFLYPEEGH